MKLAELIPLALQTSIWLTVLTLGLRSSPADLTYVLRRPKLLGRSLFAMSVLMPVVAVLLVKVMSLPVPVAVALAALALAPVPPILPKKQVKAGGDASYAIGLLVAASLVAIIGIPIAMEVMDRIFPASLSVSPAAIWGVLAFTLLLPLGLGVLFRRISPTIAERIANLVAPVAGVVLIAAFLPVVVTKWPAIAAQAQGGALLAFVIFILVGLAAGYLIGGPDADDRPVLAFACASRHPGVAIAIAHMNFPDEKAVVPAVLLYLIVSIVLSIPFNIWLKRSAANAPAPSGG